jgi:hypothetical protein
MIGMAELKFDDLPIRNEYKVLLKLRKTNTIAFPKQLF